MTGDGSGLQQALTLHRSGQLDAAEAAYRGLLEVDGRNADVLHLLGVVASGRGDPVRAVALINEALAVCDAPRFRSNLGMALLQLGRSEAARAACVQALALRPDYPEALINLGAALEALDRPAEAIDAYRRALALQPDRTETWFNMGNALRLLRRFEEAEEAYRRAAALNPASPQAQAGLGQVLREAGCPAEAETAFRAQLALTPDDADAYVNLAAALGEQDRPDSAVLLLTVGRMAAAMEQPEAHVNLAAALRQLGRLEEAEAACRRALQLRPDHPQAAGNLGHVLRETGRLRDAEAVQRRLLGRRPSDITLYNDLAITLAEAGRLQEALAVLDLGQALDPADAETRHHRAFVLLLQGRFPEGWAEYEARFDTKQGRLDRRGFTQPLWNGELLNGRTVLLHAEQGFGDTIQFCRYVPLVAQRGGRVVLEAPAPLVRLLRSLPGVTHVLSKGEALPDFDLHCPLLSLPRAFNTALDTIPAPGRYLEPPVEAAARWRERLSPDGRRHVGVVWAGNPRHINDRRRSLPFDVLAPLWQVPGVAWHGLQLGARASELVQAPPGLVEDLSPSLSDFAETAAALSCLDAVVTPDTAVAHLAGALSVPALVLLPHASDWRWMRGRAHSPWYPSLRLFRQDDTHRWEPVIDAVSVALDDMMSGHAGKLCFSFEQPPETTT